MKRWFAWPSELKESGILGMNRRNLSYILESNPRKNYPRVDNKLVTKQICEDNDIPSPKTYAVINSQVQVRRKGPAITDRSDFVIKPARGAAGRGIVVIADQSDDCYFTPSGRTLSWSDLRYHLSAIVSGLYSLGGRPDCAIIEKRIVTHPILEPYSVGGTPDVRILLYLGVPVMAMVRLPTSESGGRANLHQGAIAAAVDLVTGATYGGVCKNRVIDRHPDTGLPIAGVELPDWRAALDASMRLSDVLELGYLGVDFVFDKDQGPVVLEANARPGLAIQVAHRHGIRARLGRIHQTPESRRTGESRWELIEELAKHTPRFVS